MSFGESLKKIRLSRGLTQLQVAEKMGITKSTYCGYETGKRQPDVQKIKQLSQILGVNADELLETGKSVSFVNDDSDLTDFLEMLRNRPECRMLFSVTKDATKEEVQKAVAIIEALRKTEGHD